MRILIIVVLAVSSLKLRGSEVTYSKDGSMLSIKESIDYHKIYKRIEWRRGLEGFANRSINDDLVMILYNESGEKSISLISPGNNKMMQYILGKIRKNKDAHYDEIYRDLQTGAYLEKMDE